MKPAAQLLRATIDAYRPRLDAINDAAAADKPLAEKWSRKEILGHLVDSAANNHQRFVRLQDAAQDVKLTYEQAFWVNTQRYADEDWRELVAFWHAYNRHLARVVAAIAPAALENLCEMGYAERKPLRYVVEDYIRHLRHHLEQIVSDAPPDQRAKWHTEPVEK
jgi:hypothetical protein